MIFFILAVVVFVSGAMDSADLTPDTPPAPRSDDNLFAPARSAPAGGGCGGAYAVQPGDTLSQIARSCGISLETLIQANPGLANPNLIQPGQQIQIPAARPPEQPSPTATQAPPLTAEEQPAEPMQAQAQPAAGTVPGEESTNGGGQPAVLVTRPGGIPAEGVQPGGLVDVRVTGFPANAQVLIGVGPQDQEPRPAEQGLTAADGTLTVTFPVPDEALAGTAWVVSVYTVAEPKLDITSQPFVVGP